MKTGVAFFTAVYPAAKKFLPKFLRSLERQSYRDFSLVILNDGLSEFDFHKFDLDIREIRFKGTLIQQRQKAFHYLVRKKFKSIIFGDCDDFFAKNRIEESVRLLQHYPVVINDLTLTSASGRTIIKKYLSKRIPNRSLITSRMISDINFLGLSNSAIRSSLLRDISFPKDLPVLDWYLFSVLLAKGAKAFFTADTETYYRQHSKNIAGLFPPAANLKSRILRETEVKVSMYKHLAKVFPGKYLKKFKKMEKVKSLMFADKNYLNRYRSRFLKSLIRYPLWWETANPAYGD